MDDHDCTDVIGDLVALAAQVPPEHARLARLMSSYGISVASQYAFFRDLAHVAAGSAVNGYMLSRSRGMTPADANNHRASSTLVAMAHYLGADGPEALSSDPRIFEL